MSNQNENSYCGADEDLKGISQDDIKRKAAFKRERAEADYINRYDDGFEDGFEDGVEQERVKAIKKLFLRGDSVQSIADLYDVSTEEVQNIIERNKEVKSND